MRTFLKIMTASIVFAGCSQTAFAGATDIAFKTQATNVTTQKVKTVTVKKIVLTDGRLPQARKTASDTSRTVLFYNSTPSRTKVLGQKTKLTSTPNLFKK